MLNILTVNFEYIPFHLTFCYFVLKERVIDLKHINIKLRQKQKKKN